MTGPRVDALWERLAAKTRPVGAVATIESPRMIALLVAGAIWGSILLTAIIAMVLFSAGESAAGWITASLSAAYLATWVWHALTGEVTAPASFALGATVVNQLAIHLTLGGFANSGGFLMWGISMTFALAILVSRRAAIWAGALYVAAAIVLAFLEPSLALRRAPPPAALSSSLFAMVLIGNLAFVTSVFMFFLNRLSFERDRAERLLLNVLPAEVAAELKERGRTTARRFDSVSVLFADVVGFTERSASMDPTEMVDELNTVFTYFDGLVDKYGCEKIRTIGDGYMVAAGIPMPRDDHAHVLAAMALEMLAYSRRTGLTFRLGMNSGPAVAGVIGTRKFQYDVWGDTVNTASRMESHGEPGRIQITETTHRYIQDQFISVPRGPIEVKGKGIINTWFLEASRSQDLPPTSEGRGEGISSRDRGSS